jgi:hypothetical protein
VLIERDLLVASDVVAKFILVVSQSPLSRLDADFPVVRALIDSAREVSPIALSAVGDGPAAKKQIKKRLTKVGSHRR